MVSWSVLWWALWGEGSKDLHSLIKMMGETRVLKRARAQGRPASDRELGAVIGQIRRVLSVTCIRSQGTCLLSRVRNMGEGTRSAAGRRVLAIRVEENRRREQAAHHSAHIRGRGLSLVGEHFV